jgi:sialic acid synthase SpsE
LGIEVAIAAATLGANLLEKHITLDRGLAGPDHSTSLEPEDLKSMVRAIRRVESALGHGRKEPVEGEAEIAAVARKSLVAARALEPGKTLEPADVVVLRPGTGLSPAAMPLVLGRRLRCALQEGDLLRLDHLES